MKKSIYYLLPALLLMALASCQKEQQAPANNQFSGKPISTSLSSTVTGKYTNGFFIINEGWFGHGDGSVSFYSYDTNTKTDSIFTKENPGKNLNPVTSTLEYGTIFNNQLFLVSKVGGPVVVCDANTMQEVARIPSASGNNWQAFVGIDATHGLLSSATGLYPFSLTTYTTGTKLTTVTGNIADMILAGNYIFVLSQSQGVVVLNASTYAVVKTIPGMLVAFAKTPDGSVWTAGGTSLIKINSTTLATTTVAVPFTVFGSWAAWHPGSITASSTENAIFLADNNTWFGGTTIYKYIDGNAASLNTPFITLATGKELYGSGLGYNPALSQLVVNTVKSGFGTNYSTNDLDFYNATTGALIKDVPFSGYYFPATYAFH
ncbi:DUF5074 domain-containing protein [Mucilaginibacter sp. McL0603]|uniref:DUF5074 domain-containing protein n=1 Tax=Mucilaginibacter sp. McL0603 TaxID=3415670 RepID=UPI003CEDAE4B